MSGTAAPRNLFERLISSQLNMRAETRLLLDQRPSEGQLLALAMLSGLFWYLGSMGVIWLEQPVNHLPREELLSRAGGEFAAAFFFRTLALYLLALIFHGAARLAGGTGSGYESRVGFFWAAMVAAPIALIARLAATLPGLGFGAEIMINALGNAIFAVFVAIAVAEVHGFRRASLVLLVMTIAIAILAFIGKALLSLYI